MTNAPSKIGFCLVAAGRAEPAWQARIAAALDATGAETMILTAPLDPAALRTLVAVAQDKGVAALVANDVAAAKAAGADGVHLAWRPEIEEAYEAARTALGPDAIIGAEAGTSRHDAMTLGEAGADYVAFGRMADASDPDEAAATQRDLVAWWSEVFLVPVVASDATTEDEVATLARAGADFIAVHLPEAAGNDTASDAAWAAGLRAALRAPVGAA